MALSPERQQTIELLQKLVEQHLSNPNTKWDEAFTNILRDVRDVWHMFYYLQPEHRIGDKNGR